VIPTKPCPLIVLEPRMWSSVSHHYHATLILTPSCLMSNSYQTHHFNFMNHLMQLSCSRHVKTHKSQLIHHLIHTSHLVHKFKDKTHTSTLFTFWNQGNIKTNPFLAQHLAQAERSRPGEEDPRSGELPSPRRELDFQHENPARVLA